MIPKGPRQESDHRSQGCFAIIYWGANCAASTCYGKQERPPLSQQMTSTSPVTPRASQLHTHYLEGAHDEDVCVYYAPVQDHRGGSRSRMRTVLDAGVDFTTQVIHRDLD